MVPQFVSYAQNGEDVRIWHAFGPARSNESNTSDPLTYVEVGANYPRDLSISAALYDLGWRGLLVEADPNLAQELRRCRPEDTVVQEAAARGEGELRFFQVPGTGLGTLDESEAQAAADRGFEVVETIVPARTLDAILDDFLASANAPAINALTIDVEGAEAEVLAGLSLTRHRPWVICIEAIDPGTHIPSHREWQAALLQSGYRFTAFDGINRWYVADEHADRPVGSNAGAPEGSTLAEAIATPFHALDIGVFEWRTAQDESLRQKDRRSGKRQAWQREVVLNDVANQVRNSEYERRIVELDTALSQVQSSRTFALSRTLARVGKKGMHTLRRLRNSLPEPINTRIIRSRHLTHVTTNMAHLTEPSYLGATTEEPVTWITDQGTESTPRPPVPPGMSLTPLTGEQFDEVHAWLRNFPFDQDTELDDRMDNFDDEVGRAQRALRTRLRLTEVPTLQPSVQGPRVAFDARSLQSPAFGSRGIGRFAAAALAGLRSCIGDEQITLVIDHGLHPLPPDLAGTCRQTPRISASEVDQYSVLIEPSPMTHSPDPIVPLLGSGAYSLAVVFDFIPLHHPNVYLSGVAQRVEYTACLDALREYQDFLCISHLASEDLQSILKGSKRHLGSPPIEVAWPREIATIKPAASAINDTSGPIVLMTGDEPRKNTFGGLAGIAAATIDEDERDVVVIGMAGQDVRVHHWSIAAAMRPGEARTVDRMSDEELHRILSTASLVVVPSFDEGLSLPVIEAARAGVPVAASNIPAHRELIGHGRYLFDPTNPGSVAKAVRSARGAKRVATTQIRKLMSHRHEPLEDEVAARVGTHLVDQKATKTPSHHQPTPIRVAAATPWAPQRSGVADYSSITLTELAKRVQLTVFTTAEARVDASTGIQQRDVAEIFADPQGIQDSFDVIVTVVGNSHFHLPFVELLQHIDSIVIAHDTRMIEFYMALRGQGGVQQLMLTTADSLDPHHIDPALDDQIEDMRLLQNAGLWEIANRAQRLIMHSPSAAPLIAEQTGITPTVLPFANYRAPDEAHITDQMREKARCKLGLDQFPPGTIHLASFGYIDIRTKMTDLVVEAAAWLRQWGHPVALHLVGSATTPVHDQLVHQAQAAGLDHFNITGYQSDEQFRDWLLGVDLGVQLRVSPMLGVSGPLSDLAAYGTPAVASTGLCVDVDTPAFIYRLPDVVSPVMVAEEIEKALRDPMSAEDREHLRLNYLERKSPAIYAEKLAEVIDEVVSHSLEDR